MCLHCMFSVSQSQNLYKFILKHWNNSEPFFFLTFFSLSKYKHIPYFVSNAALFNIMLTEYYIRGKFIYPKPIQKFRGGAFVFFQYMLIKYLAWIKQRFFSCIPRVSGNRPKVKSHRQAGVSLERIWSIIPKPCYSCMLPEVNELSYDP